MAAKKSKNTHLQELILQQGLILESEVYTTLARHYGLRLNASSKVGYPLAGREGTTQEVDVFAAISKDHQTIISPFFNSVDDNGRALTLSGVINIFLIECKGHSTDGILLCRAHHQTRREKILLTNHLSHYEHTGPPTSFSVQGGAARLNSPGRWFEGIARSEVSPIVDSGAFYNFSTQKGYTEEKNKLFKATQQIETAGRLFDQVLNQSRGQVPNIRAYTVTPIICTNIPITIMQIQGGEVLLTEVEWAYLLNPQFSSEPLIPNKPDYKLIPIVQLSSLTRFCDAIMSDDPSELSIDSAAETAVHNFNIKDAQGAFREIRSEE